MYGKSAFICDHIKAFSILVSVATTAPYLYCSWEQKATEKRTHASHACPLKMPKFGRRYTPLRI